MAVNPVDPPAGGPWHPPAPPISPPPSPAVAGSLELYGSAGDTMNGAVAVLQVASALVRYSAEVAVRTSRNVVLSRVPLVGRARGLRRGLPGPIARVLAHPAATAVEALAAAADELVPLATRAVLARLDIPALVREYVDLDRLAAMLDVDAVVARVDLDAVLDRVDVDAVAARLDVDAVAARLDLDAVAARLDLDSLVDKVDVARVVDRVDLDAAVDRVDVDRIIARTDIAGLARYIVQVIDLPGLLRASTGSVSSEMVRSVRDQGADADRAVERVVDRLLHRQGRRTETDRGAPRPGHEGSTP